MSFRSPFFRFLYVGGNTLIKFRSREPSFSFWEKSVSASPCKLASG
jgi:hypothetical protein